MDNLGKEYVEIPCVPFLCISVSFELDQSKKSEIKMFTELVSGSPRKKVTDH